MTPSKSSAPFALLLPLAALAFALNTGTFAYYAQHFYLPSSEFADPFGKRIDSQTLPMGDKSSDEWATQPKIVLVRAEDEGTEEGQQGQKAAKGPSLLTKAPVIPRRTLRHLFDEFGADQMGRQYKRMKPCFYSPIQCLMK